MSATVIFSRNFPAIPDTDILGDARQQGTRVNMGAYETVVAHISSPTNAGIYFNGQDAYGVAPASVSAADKFTIMAWLKVASLPDDNANAMMAFYNGTNGTNGYGIRVGAGGSLQFVQGAALFGLGYSFEVNK